MRRALFAGACLVLAIVACRSAPGRDPDDALVVRLADEAVAAFKASGVVSIAVSDPGNRGWVEHLRRGGLELFLPGGSGFELLVRGDYQELVLVEPHPPNRGLGFLVFDRNDPSRRLTVRDERIGPIKFVSPQFECRNSASDDRILDAARAFVASWPSARPPIEATFDTGHERFREALSQRHDASFFAKSDMALRVLGRGNYVIVSVRCGAGPSEFSHALIVDRSDPSLLFALPNFF